MRNEYLFCDAVEGGAKQVIKPRSVARVEDAIFGNMPFIIQYPGWDLYVGKFQEQLSLFVKAREPIG